MTKSSEDKVIFDIDEQTIQTRKYFVYKDQRYEVDFDKLKKNCRYIYKNRKLYKNDENINLLNEEDENIELTEEAIKGFISICENKKCEISRSTINSLHYLSNKYDYPELKRLTSEYLNQFSNELCLETLLFKISMKKQNTSKEEDYISYHMSQFIVDEKMKNLPITVLDRILLKYFKMKDGIEKVDEEEIVNFLFSILDSAGRKASILFGHLDFGEKKLEIIQRLVKGYSDVFDFNMLNSTLAKTVTELTSEMVKQNENFKIIFDQMKKCIEDEKKEIERIKEESLKKEKYYEQKKVEMINDYTESVEKLKNEIEIKMSSIEQRCSDNSITKCKQIIFDILDFENFKKLNQELKYFVVCEVIREKNPKYSNKLIERILFYNDWYVILAKLSINEGKKAEQFILENLDGKNSQHFSIELKYPMNSDLFYDFLKDNEEYSNQFEITLSIENEEYFQHNYKINKFIHKCKISTEQEKIDASQLKSMINLKQLEINGKIKIISDSSFKNLTNLQEIKLPPTVTTIGNNAFENCSSLTQISIPSSVTTIGDNCFEGCIKLEQVTFDSFQTKIKSKSFNNCNSLKKLIFASSSKKDENKNAKSILYHTDIDSSLFNQTKGEDQLTIISLINMIVYTNNEKVENAEKLHNLLTYLNEEQKRSKASSKIIQYINIDEYENEEHYVITKEMTEILNDNNSLNSKEFIARVNAFPFIYIQIQFPSQVYSNLFEKIKTLKSTVQNKLKIYIYITGIDHTDENDHFQHDSNINTVCLDSSVTKMLYIGDNSFCGCSSLARVIIPSTVTKIGNSSFRWSSLKKVAIPPSVTEIGSNSFRDCGSLIQVSIPSSVTKIGDVAFGDCRSLNQVTFSNPSSLKLIEYCAFLRCSSLTQITIPSSVTTIGSRVFDGCSSLTQITIPSSVTTIGSRVFDRCSSLTQITIPSSVNSIGEGAFLNCSSLTQIINQSSINNLSNTGISSNVKIIKC